MRYRGYNTRPDERDSLKTPTSTLSGHGGIKNCKQKRGKT